MDDAKRALVDEWMTKARRDLASAERLMAGDPPFLDTAVYHCQQAAEKALKGFLAAADRPVRKVHDLVLLLGECEEIDGSLGELDEAAVVLTPYGTSFRYPGELREPEPGEAQEAIEVARRIVERIDHLLILPAG